MAQPSIANYFHSRKRTAADETKVTRARKVLILDKNSSKTELKSLKGLHDEANKIVFSSNSFPESVSKNSRSKQKPSELQESKSEKVASAKGDTMPVKHRKLREIPHQTRIQQLFDKMAQMQNEKAKEPVVPKQTEINVDIEREKHVTPPSSPIKPMNILQNKSNTVCDPSLREIKRKLTSSSKLAELKESMTRFKQASGKLEELEKKTEALKSPTLKTFKSINLEVNLSPKKIQSPEKAYLSPKKETSSVRRNLLESLSPTKRALASTSIQRKPVLETSTKESSLTLPYKYRFIAEVFRAIDTVSQLLYNRKETITFKKLKPGVEKILKRNFVEKHLAQIKHIYPDAFNIEQTKLRAFGTGLKSEQWEMVIVPSTNDETMTSEFLLQRRRQLYNALIEKVKDYHEEFLKTLDPPLEIPREGIKRWHPLFDIEKVPDIETAPLPQPPEEERLTSGQEVLERARTLFSCNTRMEKALERLKEARESESKPQEESKEPPSILKGIPKALLEKVRQRQAAKALDSITRSEAKEKEVQKYNRLPEMARLVRNLFVAEKKNVLPLDAVLLRLDNSIRSFLNRKDLEEQVRLLAKEVPDWLVFHTIRNCVYVKIDKSADLSVIIKKLENLAKIKDET